MTELCSAVNIRCCQQPWGPALTLHLAACGMQMASVADRGKAGEHVDAVTREIASQGVANCLMPSSIAVQLQPDLEPDEAAAIYAGTFLQTGIAESTVASPRRLLLQMLSLQRPASSDLTLYTHVRVICDTVKIVFCPPSCACCHAGEHQQVDLDTLQQAMLFAKYAVAVYSATLFEIWPSLWPGLPCRCAWHQLICICWRTLHPWHKFPHRPRHIITLLLRCVERRLVHR